MTGTGHRDGGLQPHALPALLALRQGAVLQAVGQGAVLGQGDVLQAVGQCR